mmetsp:Transcript_43710/g.52856  ORF Transcript_43710/g.52856 Transcript_43710/m.52856 type:complete len:242 (+) Transcript_43710:387-1112(+)
MDTYVGGSCDCVDDSTCNVFRIEDLCTLSPGPNLSSNSNPHLLSSLLVCVVHDQICLHVSRLDISHPDTSSYQLLPKTLGYGPHKVLRGAIHGQAGPNIPPSIAANIYNVPSITIGHAFDHCTTAIDYPFAVDVNGLLPLILVQILHEREVHYSCAVHHDIHRTESVLCCFDEGLAILPLHYISRNRKRRASRSLNFGLHCVEIVNITCSKSDLRSLRCEGEGDSGTNTTGSACHDCYFAL